MFFSFFFICSCNCYYGRYDLGECLNRAVNTEVKYNVKFKDVLCFEWDTLYMINGYSDSLISILLRNPYQYGDNQKCKFIFMLKGAIVYEYIQPSDPLSVNYPSNTAFINGFDFSFGCLILTPENAIFNVCRKGTTDGLPKETLWVTYLRDKTRPAYFYKDGPYPEQLSRTDSLVDTLTGQQLNSH